jgi:hypothetical protein
MIMQQLTLRALLGMLRAVGLLAKSGTGYVASPKIRQSAQVGSSTVPANSFRDIAVTFPTPFENVPEITLTMVNGWDILPAPSAGYYGTTKTGFSLRVSNSASVAVTFAVWWIAEDPAYVFGQNA